MFCGFTRMSSSSPDAPTRTACRPFEPSLPSTSAMHPFSAGRDTSPCSTTRSPSASVLDAGLLGARRRSRMWFGLLGDQA